ncbi:MFS transporter [Nocardioides yefusunii]|uniref:MFS transporter n=1 Tax=Nocardioides yefusunii TaxID=2500546 RepID=A0ABW1QZA9_9ACTN|nr:MFS transporter [Nocardioides yefusunii]
MSDAVRTPTPDAAEVNDAPSSTRWWALVVLGLTQLMVVLDSTIVAIALPSAQADLNMADDQRQWIITAYALAFGSLLLLGGRIADYWGRKRSFMVGMIGFGAASVWGGLAGSAGELIAARGLQGLFAAVLAPAALAMLTVLFSSGKERTVAFAVFGIIAGTGAAFGLLLGGALTQYADWRWCLFVNVFFVIVGVIGGAKLLVESRAEGRNTYDLVGAVLVTLGLGSLVYGFSRAEHGWVETDTLGFIAAGVVLVALFVFAQTKVSNPLLPLRVVTDRVRGAAFLLQAIIGAVMIGAMLYLTFHFQIVMGFGPLRAGFGSVAMTVVIMATAPIATKMFEALGARVVLTLGAALAGAGLVVLSFITADGGYWTHVFPSLVIMALGFSLIFVPLQNLALAGVEPHDAGVASAVANSAMNIGGSIAVAVFTALSLSKTEDALAGGADPMTALVEGYTVVFLAGAGAMFVGAVLCFLMIPQKKDLVLDPTQVAVGAH